MDKIKLRLGKMTSKEIAEWFGYSYNVYRKGEKKEMLLEDLKNYADFEEVYGGILIKEIYNEGPYVKNNGRVKNKEIIKGAFNDAWNSNGIDTCLNVSNKIFNQYEDSLTIGENTTYIYTLEARNELYGKPFLNGKCFYQWSKVTEIDENGIIVYTPFNEEEEEIKKKLLKKYFATDAEKEILIAEMVESGEISKSEAYDLLCEYKGLNKGGFMKFKKELEETIGFKVVKATVLKDFKMIESGKRIEDG